MELFLFWNNAFFNISYFYHYFPKLHFEIAILHHIIFILEFANQHFGISSWSRTFHVPVRAPKWNHIIPIPVAFYWLPVNALNLFLFFWSYTALPVIGVGAGPKCRDGRFQKQGIFFNITKWAAKQGNEKTNWRGTQMDQHKKKAAARHIYSQDWRDTGVNN